MFCVALFYLFTDLSRANLARIKLCRFFHCLLIGFRGIEHYTGVPHTTVMSWVKKLGEDIERFRPQNGKIEPVSIMELDEMWHFVQKKKEQMLDLASL